MKRYSTFLLLVILVLAFSGSSWAQFPCDPGDSVDVCCGADEDLGGYSRDLGTCDTLHVVPWPNTDTCLAGECINNPGEKFPCFLFVNLLVTHDSNTFWWDTSAIEGRWVQDSIRAFVIPLEWTRTNPSAYCSVSSYWNQNAFIGPPAGRSVFRHMIEAPNDTIRENRMMWMFRRFLGEEWDTRTLAMSTESSYFRLLLAATGMPADMGWFEGDTVLLATITFRLEDSMTICIDSSFWPPNSRFTFTRFDAENYVPRDNTPLGIKVNIDGSVDTLACSLTDVRWIEDWIEEEGSRPAGFSVSQNYPNPFNPVTNFKFTLPEASSVKIEIFNILGQRVKALLDEDMRAGVYVVDWDGKDERGAEVSSGIYFYRIKAGDFSDIKRMVLLK